MEDVNTKKRIAWNKGKRGLQTHSSEWKRMMSLKMKGRKMPPRSAETLKKMSLCKIGKPNLKARGKKRSIETKRKMSLARLGVEPWNKGKEYKLGWRHTEETKKKLSEAKKGANNPVKRKEVRDKISRTKLAVNGGIAITPIHHAIRNSFEYKLWRKAVFERDRFTCRFCYKIGGKIQADHIKRFSEYPELRFAIDNGRTLCVECHRKTDTWGNVKRLLV